MLNEQEKIEVLHEAIKLIESGTCSFICVALNSAIYDKVNTDIKLLTTSGDIIKKYFFDIYKAIEEEGIKQNPEFVMGRIWKSASKEFRIQWLNNFLKQLKNEIDH